MGVIPIKYSKLTDFLNLTLNVNGSELELYIDPPSTYIIL